ncbi:DUF4345 family protein [Candidatus Bipolaricaulota bacterium]|nr:DUF4345 family protein [Candidatus Bipolaricaulota bacterium]
MTVMDIVKITIAIATIGFGMLSVVSPKAAEKFTGLEAPGPRGISEIRAVLVGMFVGLGTAALIYQNPSAYGTLGIGYLGIGVVRAGSIYFDKASTASNWGSLGFEVICGVLLLI